MMEKKRTTGQDNSFLLQEGEDWENQFIFSVEQTAQGKRLDVFLTEQMFCADGDSHVYSRSYIQKLVKEGRAVVDGKAARGNFKLAAGQTVKLAVPIPEELKIEPENIPLDIVYEDEDVLLVNKPKGMVVHPAAGHSRGTLVNALLYHCKGQLSGINGVMRPGIVHRIDMDTTGLLIVCKNDFSHQSLAEQLKEHSITRKYRAIVHGVIKEEHLTIDKPIGRHPANRKKMAADVKNGKPAITHVKVLQRFDRFTYIECRLETGRTHQIRVHMSDLHHPLLGDTVYGPAKERFLLEGQVLHAMIFGFVHPRTGKYMEFTAPLPRYFEELLQKLNIHG